MRDPPEPVDILERARAAAESIAWEAKERNSIVDVQETAASITGHSRNIERMLRNLIENSVRHSPKRGRVEVTIAGRADTIEIAVSDDGLGIAKEDRDRIFEPFYRGVYDRADDIPGAGLGLPIARQIARSHGGDLILDANREKGSRFVIRLPAGDSRDEGTTMTVNANR